MATHVLRRIDVGVLSVILVGCSNLSSPLPSAPRSAAVAPSATSTATPSASEIAFTVQLPNPGGTCTASQFVLGSVTSEYEPSVLFYRHVGLFQPMRNAGGDCVLKLPSMIGLLSSAGSWEAVRATNGGTEVCVDASPGTGVERTCHFVYPPSYMIRSGQSVSIEASVSWPEDSPYSLPPCPSLLQDVTRVEFPLAVGSLDINFESQVHWKIICSSAQIGFSVVLAK
jgi:hypothetical protein